MISLDDTQQSDDTPAVREDAAEEEAYLDKLEEEREEAVTEYLDAVDVSPAQEEQLKSTSGDDSNSA